MGRIITLTTDFGLADEFVGVMKGVILGRAPKARIVDLSHQIGAHDVRQAAFLLGSAYRFFPAGTVHVAVVDPGVGSSRRLVLVEVGGQLFLAPDNGLLSLVLLTGDFVRVWRVENRELFLAAVSATFQGRDILAPVAALLATGLEPEAVGPSLAATDLLMLTDLLPAVERKLKRITGRVEQVDRFGNLVTNIPGCLLTEVYDSGLKQLTISFGGHLLKGVSATFSEVAAGEVTALIGGRGYLELAVNLGRADLRLDGRVGVPVMVMED
jgi:S-adenosylmethionine hydrolase